MKTREVFQIQWGIPVLIAVCLVGLPAQAKYGGGTGEPNDPYQIATAADLIALGESPGDYGKHFILTADIDLDPNLPGRKIFDKAVIGPEVNEAKWWPFGETPFTGVFDGNGHTISHLTIVGVEHVGLFGQLASGAEVNDLGVVDVNIVGSSHYVGGLVGSNGGTVTHGYSTGAISGDWYVGGLVGYNGGAVTQCYSTGSLSGDWYVGGLVGWTYNSAVTQCFWDTQMSGQAESTGGTGKTTAEMQMAKTFLDAGWDFVGETANGTEDIWWINEGKDYPRLWWELP